METLAWYPAAALVDLSPDEPLGVEVNGTPIGIYCLGDAVYALSDICTHEHALLSRGFIDAGRIECPLHQACFDIRSGKCFGPMAEEDLQTFPVRIEDGRVFVAL